MKRLFLFLVLSAAFHTTEPATAQSQAPTPAPAVMMCKNFANIRCVDAENSAGWPGSDIGAWINSAVNDLPSINVNGHSYKAGKIMLAPAGNRPVKQTTPVANIGPYVSVEGPGPQQLILSCTMNGPCWTVRDNPFSNGRGSSIGGFTLLGVGGYNANAVGIYTGDLNNARFHDINIDDFKGAGSACIWIDNQQGWFERNIFLGIELGVHIGASEAEQGCTKELRFTTAPNTDTSSFGYNEWIGIRMSLKAKGQIGWSIEGANPIDFYNCFVTGNANMAAGTTLFSITGSSPTGAGAGCFIDFRAEALGPATGWSIPATTSFNYLGPGIVQNNQDGPNLTDVGATTLLHSISPTNRRSYSFGTNQYPGVSAQSFYVPNAGNTNSFQTGFGWNAYWDGANWRTNGNAGHNGGALLLDTNRGQDPTLYVCPDNGGASQTISDASLASKCIPGALPRLVASGSAALSAGSVAPGSCQSPISTAAPNALSTDTVEWTYGAVPGVADALLNVTPSVTRGNVNFTRCNSGAAAQIGTAIAVNWKVIR